MDFDLTQDQQEIKRVARELLAARSPWATVREAAEARRLRRRAVARAAASSAGPGIAVAEEHGGQGLGAVELAVLLEELGYACAATPFLSTAVGRGRDPGVRHATSSGRAGCPALASGEATAGVGTRELCADGADAAVLVLLDGDDGRAASTAPTPTSSRSTTIDSTRRYARVTRRQTASRSAAGAADRVRAAMAAEVVGVCQRALDMTLAYVKDRKQFGVPVGSFQAVVAPLRADAAGHGERALDGVLRRLGGRRGPRAAAPRRRRSAGAAAADGGRDVTAARSRPTAASASPGRPTSTGSTSAPSSTPRCSAARAATARRSRGSPPGGSRSPRRGSPVRACGRRFLHRRPHVPRRPEQVARVPHRLDLRQARVAGAEGRAHAIRALLADEVRVRGARRRRARAARGSRGRTPPSPRRRPGSSHRSSGCTMKRRVAPGQRRGGRRRAGDGAAPRHDEDLRRAGRQLLVARRRARRSRRRAGRRGSPPSSSCGSRAGRRASTGSRRRRSGRTGRASAGRRRAARRGRASPSSTGPAYMPATRTTGRPCSSSGISGSGGAVIAAKARPSSCGRVVHAGRGSARSTSRTRSAR